MRYFNESPLRKSITVERYETVESIKKFKVREILFSTIRSFSMNHKD